jgi:hypothetical protein
MGREGARGRLMWRGIRGEVVCKPRAEQGAEIDRAASDAEGSRRAKGEKRSIGGRGGWRARVRRLGCILKWNNSGDG